MKSTQYLYGKLPQHLVDERKTLAQDFISFAENAYAEIASKDVKTNADIERATDIKKAIKFNKFIIDEVD